MPLTRKLQEAIGHIRRSCRHLRDQRQLDQQRAQCQAATDIIPSSFTMNNNVTLPLRRSHKNETATPAAKKSTSRPKSGPSKNRDTRLASHPTNRTLRKKNLPKAILRKKKGPNHESRLRRKWCTIRYFNSLSRL